jgi:hypothetical protein
MYNMVFGSEGPAKRGQVLLAMLGFTSFTNVGRYRDAWVETSEDGPIIAIYTRNGGGNRESCWQPDGAFQNSVECDCPACVANYRMPAHPGWAMGRDDEFDSTYRTEYFQAPAEYLDLLEPVAGDPVDTSQRWHEAIANLDPANANH